MKRPDMSLTRVQVDFSRQNKTKRTIAESVPDSLSLGQVVLMTDGENLCEGQVLALKEDKALISADLTTFWAPHNEKFYGPKKGRK